MEKYNKIRNPFVDTANASQGLTSLEAEQFINLSTDLALKSIHFHGTDSAISFLVKVFFEFSLVSCKAFRILIPFAALCFCETGFSVVAVIKSKYCYEIDTK